MKLFMLALINPKLCKECIHYIPNKQECTKFSNQNIITGDISFESAYKVRHDSSKCSEEGLHYKKNKFQLITDSYYFLKNDILITTMISVIILTFLDTLQN